MRYHLYQYCIENRDTVEPLVTEVLTKRKISYDMYLAKMYQCLTCGFETTLLILAHMYKIAILVIRQDFVWISSKVAPIMCPVVLVQDETGFFLGMRSPNLIYVGSVPIVTVPYSIMHQGLFATSTPSRTSNRPTNTVFSCGLSPINSDNTTTDTNISLENKRRKKASNTKSNKTKDNARKSQPIMTAVRNQEMNKDLSTDTSTTSQETKALREKIKKFEEKTPDSQLSTTIDPNEEDNADDLSTTIDPNAETNVDNGQRTDISSDHLSFSADNTLVMSKETDTDKSCTEVYSTTHDESHTEVTKTVKASNQVSCMQIFLERQEPRMMSQNMSWKIRQLKMKKYRERRVMIQRILTTCLPHCSLK